MSRSVVRLRKLVLTSVACERETSECLVAAGVQRPIQGGVDAEDGEHSAALVMPTSRAVRIGWPWEEPAMARLARVAHGTMASRHSSRPSEAVATAGELTRCSISDVASTGSGRGVRPGPNSVANEGATDRAVAAAGSDEATPARVTPPARRTPNPHHGSMAPPGAGGPTSQTRCSTRWSRCRAHG